MLLPFSRQISVVIFWFAIEAPSWSLSKTAGDPFPVGARLPTYMNIYYIIKWQYFSVRKNYPSFPLPIQSRACQHKNSQHTRPGFLSPHGAAAHFHTTYHLLRAVVGSGYILVSDKHRIGRSMLAQGLLSSTCPIAISCPFPMSTASSTTCFLPYVNRYGPSIPKTRTGCQ